MTGRSGQTRIAAPAARRGRRGGFRSAGVGRPQNAISGYN
ncbi:MAG: hypothetical protein OJF55_002746 [Rhodanobacteraceae bacterium]|nr:MAG: hypothetical protein OJF55_002746 [Rhodanobacteraceae bacterium]